MTKVRKADTAIGQVLGAMGTACVRTPCGARRIENVRPGDMLVTRDNGLQTVRMVWSKTISAAEMKAEPSQAPIRLGARAIGPMMPQREMMLAPSHRVLVPGWRLAGVPDTRFCLIEAQHREVVGRGHLLQHRLRRASGICRQWSADRKLPSVKEGPERSGRADKPGYLRAFRRGRTGPWIPVTAL